MTPEPWPQPDRGQPSQYDSSRHDSSQYDHAQRAHYDPAQNAPAGYNVGQADQLPGEFGPPGLYPGDQPQPSFGLGPARTNALAISALACGIGQFLLGLLIAGNILLAIPALVLGVVALPQISSRGERGRGMAIAGVVLGALGVLYFALVLVLLIAGLSASN